VRFAGLVFNFDARMLARDSGEAIPLTRGEFALLRMFVARPGWVISRGTLLDAVASRRFESFDRSIDVLVGNLRRKIEPEPKRPRLIVTVRSEGYRFDGLTQPLFASQRSSIAGSASPEGPGGHPGSDSLLPELSPALGAAGGVKMPTSEGRKPPRLSIVVLPFANIGGDPEQEHFVDGVTESLTTDLSRIRGALVIARNTAFTYKGKSGDVKTIARDLNVRYVLEGSVQRSGNRMRVSVQLVDAETVNHLWAERFDKPLADLFDMQDEIVARLSGALNSQLAAAEARRAEKAPTPDSMDLYFQGLARYNKGRTPDNLSQARSFFERALSADPDNVEAVIGSARLDVREGANLFVVDPTAAFAAAEGKLTEALSLVPDHARGHRLLGYVEILTKRAPQGIAECQRSLQLDRNLASAHAFIGLGKIFVGRAEETEAHVGEALRLSPSDTNAHTWKSFAGYAKTLLGSYEPAVAWFRRAIEANRNYPVAYFNLAAALAQLGRLDEAHIAAKAGLALNPTFTVSRADSAWTAMSDDTTYLVQLRQRLLAGLRKAGIPEG
jgi:TolB-like protein/tetratricopeptide (TPR) repeat protein/DNA-binding winged helix-turn-helix (wHTH) protein